jgi:aryl-alcohol dehydrogenase-like predicted oxidoreductase
VLAHPAVTSVIIGPRTMEQLESLLSGADSYYTPPSLADTSLRRR